MRRMTLASGTRPASYRETATWVTRNSSAACACVKPLTFRHSLSFMELLIPKWFGEINILYAILGLEQNIPNRYPPNMASKLRQIRERRGWSQSQLAERVNTTQVQIGRLEKGDRRLTVEWLQRLAQALDCKPIDLMDNGLAEEEARYEAPPDGERVMRALIPTRFENCFWLRAGNDALNLRGIVAGDFLICERIVEPQEGDLVVVTVETPDARAHTMLREMADGLFRPVSTNTVHRILQWDPDDPHVGVLGRIIYRVGGADLVAA